MMHATGDGVARDAVEAVRWYRLAAERGNADAQNDLAVMYDAGEGVAEDDAEAVRWYRRAAAGGNTSAQYNLGLMYANGDGVRRDHARAYLWLSLAVATSASGVDRAPFEEVARRLSPGARAGVDRLATSCRETAFKDCGEPDP
jgi:hypothetical protein